MRLTEKDIKENHYFVKPINKDVAIDFESRIKADDKLGQLEDIEDDFGIDFILLNKICQNGLYFKKEAVDVKSLKKGVIYYEDNYNIHIEFFGCYKKKRMGVSIMICVGTTYYGLKISEYGKTWALTKEELA